MIEYSRREAIAAGALALVGTVTTGSVNAQSPPPPKPTRDDPKSDPAAIKTRTASCMCGQLRVTCTGPDPKRIVMCSCFLCQKMTGSVFSSEATFPKEEVKIEGKSTAFKFPVEGAPPVKYRNCSRTGITLHFCPVCGSSVYYVLKETPENIGVKVGNFADPTFPPPIISGYEEYKHPWVMDIEALPMPGGHHE